VQQASYSGGWSVAAQTGAMKSFMSVACDLAVQLGRPSS
jgi:hypothetical protein